MNIRLAGARAPSPRGWAILAGVAVVGAGLLFGIPWLAAQWAPKPAAQANPAPPGMFRATEEQWSTLQFAAAEPRPFRVQLTTDGKIAADDDRTTQVFSPFSGRVTEVWAKAGDEVRKGQRLFAVQALEFVQARNDLVAAGAQVRLAEANEARQHALYTASGAALKDWQQSQADLATARAALAAARDRLGLLGTGSQQISGLERDGAGAGATGEATVASPIAGTVLQRAVGLGQNLASVSSGGAAPNFVVSDLSTVWLVANLREADGGQAHLGQTIEVRATALPGEVFRGKLDYIAPAIDPATHRITVRATIANPGRRLRPEMFTEARLLNDTAGPAVSVPEAAVIFEGDAARVWVAEPNRLLALRQIRAGREEDGLIEVVSGLKPGETVVTSGSLFIDRAASGQ